LRLIESLRRDIGVNLAGVGMALDLLDHLCAPRRGNEWLRSRLWNEHHRKETEGKRWQT
jgi:hypothetical protein